MKLRTRTIVLIGLLELLVIGGVIWYVWGRPQGRAERLSGLGRAAQRRGWTGPAGWLKTAAGDVKAGHAETVTELLKRSHARLVAGKVKEAEEIALQALKGSGRSRHGTDDHRGEATPDELRRDIHELDRIAADDRSRDVWALASYLAARKRLALAEQQYSAMSHQARYRARKTAADDAVALAKRFPDSHWAPKALLLAATQHALIGEDALARREFEQLVNDYPKTPAAEEALRRLREQRQRGTVPEPTGRGSHRRGESR